MNWGNQNEWKLPTFLTVYNQTDHCFGDIASGGAVIWFLINLNNGEQKIAHPATILPLKLHVSTQTLRTNARTKFNNEVLKQILRMNFEAEIWMPSLRM